MFGRIVAERQAVDRFLTFGGLPVGAFVRSLPRWQARAHYDWAVEALAEDHQQHLEDLAATLGLPHREAGNLGVVAWRWRIEGTYPDPPDLPRLREVWTRAAVVYDSDHVEPIRLGGLEVFSLEALPEIVYTAQELTRARVDFGTVLLGLGFSFEEARFLTLHKGDGLRTLEAGAVLGWDRLKTRAVEQRCRRRARRLGAGWTGPGRVKIGTQEWPDGLFERLAGGRLALRPPA